MKILMFLIMLLTLPYHKNNNENIACRSYVVMEAVDGKILEGKEVCLQRSVASISKIMTAIIALESYKIYDIVEIGDEIDNVVGSAIYLEKGTKITIIDLVYGLLLRSGNDAAMTIAYHVGNKNIASFVTLMNQKALEIGMKHSIFNNPHGLDIDEEGNISCALDMALLMRYCNKNELFRKISETKNYRVHNIGTWKNKNKLLHNYEYCIGGKTGFTAKAKRTLVTASKKDNLELIVVTLDCGNDFNVHRYLYNKYFNEYIFLILMDKGINYIDGYKFNCAYKIGVMIDKKRMNNLLIIYYINIDELMLNFTLCYQDGTKEEIGPHKIEHFERIS